MPFTHHEGIRIHYRIEGKGRPLILLHGFGASSEQFYFTGWVAALRDHYRLIAMDVRGHGMSDKPHEPEAYRMELLVGDVAAVLDDLGIQRSHYFGYSMGGEIGYGVAKYAPNRVTSLILGGANTRDPDPDHPSPGSERTIALLRSGREAMVAANRERIEREIKTAQRPSVLEAILPQRLKLVDEVDPEALIAMVRGQWQKDALQIRAVLPGLTVPCLIFVGEADSCFEEQKSVSALVPHGRFISFPGLGHMEAASRLDLLLAPILGFLAEADSGLKE